MTTEKLGDFFSNKPRRALHAVPNGVYESHKSTCSVHYGKLCIITSVGLLVNITFVQSVQRIGYYGGSDVPILLEEHGMRFRGRLGDYFHGSSYWGLAFELQRVSCLRASLVSTWWRLNVNCYRRCRRWLSEDRLPRRHS